MQLKVQVIVLHFTEERQEAYNVEKKLADS